MLSRPREPPPGFVPGGPGLPGEAGERGTQGGGAGCRGRKEGEKEGRGEISEEAALSRPEHPHAVICRPCVQGEGAPGVWAADSRGQRGSLEGSPPLGVGGSWVLPMGMPASHAKVCGTQRLTCGLGGRSPESSRHGSPRWREGAGRGTGPPPLQAALCRCSGPVR